MNEDFESELYDEGFLDDIESFSDTSLDDEDEDWDDEDEPEYDDADYWDERQAAYDDEWPDPLELPSYGS